MDKQLVIFELSCELYGVEISAVESIIKMQSITRVPHAPGFVEGVTNLRGVVLPVIDLRKRFGLQPGGETKENRIVVVDIQDKQVGMIVDAVSEVLSIQEEQIDPPASILTTVETRFLIGIARVEDRLVILLDLAQVLTDQEQNDLERLPEAV